MKFLLLSREIVQYLCTVKYFTFFVYSTCDGMVCRNYTFKIRNTELKRKKKKKKLTIRLYVFVLEYFSSFVDLSAYEYIKNG